MPRSCLQCSAPLLGRSDKLFCSAKCKNTYHYAKRLPKPSVIQEVDGILHKNHELLQQVFTGEKTDKLKLPRMLLDKMGFNFNYHTGTYVNRQGKTYHYVYDFAWMEFSMQEVLLVRRTAKR